MVVALPGLWISLWGWYNMAFSGLGLVDLGFVRGFGGFEVVLRVGAGWCWVWDCFFSGLLAR